MKLSNAASIAAAVTIASSATDAFLVPASTTTAFRRSSTSIDMGKSQVMPGPAGKASSGPSTSEYRQNKMKKRLSKKKKGKKGGGFSSVDDLEDDGDVEGGAPRLMEVELVDEPEGGEEVAPIEGSVGGSESIRLKDLGPVDESDEAHSLREELGAPVHNFWLTAVAGGDAIRKTRAIVARDASKKSNFPGFRPGQIPPYAQPQMTNFALREVMVTSCQEAIGKFGVKEINEGQLGAVTFNEDVDVISKKYDIKGCPGVPFTANFRAYFDPDIVRDDATEGAGKEEETAADEKADDNN